MAFTFGQALLQGVQAGQRNKQAQDDLQFRREAQQALNELNRLRLEQSGDQFDRSLQQSADQFTDTQKFRREGLAQAADQFIEDIGFRREQETFRQGEFVTGNIAGQNFSVRGIDLLNDRTRRSAISAQNRALAPVPITPEVLQAAQAAREGRFEDISGFSSDPRLFASILAPSIGIGLDPLARLQQEEIQRQITTSRALNEFGESASQIKGIDPSRIAEPEVGFFRGVLRGLAGESAQEFTARRQRNEAARGTTAQEFEGAIGELQELTDQANSLPPQARQQAFQFIAPEVSRAASDIQDLLGKADLPEGKRKEFERSVTRMVAIHLQNAPQQDPQVQALSAAFNEAVNDGDTKTMLEISKVLASLRGQQTRQSDVERKAANDRFENLFGR